MEMIAGAGLVRIDYCSGIGLGKGGFTTGKSWLCKSRTSTLRSPKLSAGHDVSSNLLSIEDSQFPFKAVLTQLHGATCYIDAAATSGNGASTGEENRAAEDNISNNEAPSTVLPHTLFEKDSSPAFQATLAAIASASLAAENHFQVGERSSESSRGLTMAMAMAMACAPLALISPHEASAMAMQSGEILRLSAAEIDPGTAKLAITILGPLFTAFNLLFIVRIVMSWYPQLPVGKFPFSVAYAPTEPVLGPTRRLIPPVGGVDVAPVIWVALMSFLNEILLGQQGLLVLLSQQQP